jgi:hypothetical protein
MEEEEKVLLLKAATRGIPQVGWLITRRLVRI